MRHRPPTVKQLLKAGFEVDEDLGIVYGYRTVNCPYFKVNSIASNYGKCGEYLPDYFDPDPTAKCSHGIYMASFKYMQETFSGYKWVPCFAAIEDMLMARGISYYKNDQVRLRPQTPDTKFRCKRIFVCGASFRGRAK